MNAETARAITVEAEERNERQLESLAGVLVKRTREKIAARAGEAERNAWVDCDDYNETVVALVVAWLEGDGFDCRLDTDGDIHVKW